jgi:hypothetical protein
MANTYTKIESITASGSVAQIAFNSIPQTFTDLVLRVSGRSAAASTSAIITAFNGNTSTINSNTRLIGGGSGGANSDRFSAQSYGSVFNNAMNFTSYTASIHGNSEMYIPNYANASLFKTYLIDGVSENSGATANQNTLAGLWRSNSAITSINVLDANGTNLTSSSTFTLYGIKNTP